MNPIVSIIIPCYNQARFLPDTINSLIEQTLPNWECIIINDGSTDNTHQVAIKLANNEQRIHYIQQKNQGLSGARNTGLNHAQGRYIQFLDADDLIEPEKLRLQVDSLAGVNELSLCYSDYRHCHENNVLETLKRDDFPPPRFIMLKPLYDIAKRWETQFSIPVHAFLFDARFFKEQRIHFDMSLPNHEDWDCWMRIFALDPIVKFTPGQLAIYRICESSMCVDHIKMYHGFNQAIKKQQYIFHNDPIMSSILSEKLREIQKTYGIKPPNSTLMKFCISTKHIYKAVMPWPIQKFIINISQIIQGGHRPHEF